MASTTGALDSAYSNALGTAVSNATGGSDLGKAEFLQLLVTQFQYQDPLNPMEDKEFIAQLAQFSSLEQNMKLNENMENLLSLQQQQTVIGASNYIGKTVSARGYGVSWEPNSTNTGGRSSTVDWATGEDAASVTRTICFSMTLPPPWDFKVVKMITQKNLAVQPFFVQVYGRCKGPGASWGRLRPGFCSVSREPGASIAAFIISAGGPPRAAAPTHLCRGRLPGRPVCREF